MKNLFRAGPAGLLLLLALAAVAAEPAREFTCRPKTVEGSAGRRTVVTVLAVTDPGITARRYSLSGRIRYEGVEGRGFLEMWSYFPNRGRFFSRTLGPGNMRPLSDSSGWREFVLPFFITDAAFPPPEKLVLNVVLPGSGKFEIGPVLLREFGENEDPMQVPGQWWGQTGAGLIGGLGGALIGCIGALLGTLSSRGRARRFVLAAMWLCIVVGAVTLGAGVYALAVAQPYEVYFPLLLLGGVSLAINAGLYRPVANRYVTLELRKMHAQDS